MKANTEISLRGVPHYSKVQSEALNARWVYGTWRGLAHKNYAYWWGGGFEVVIAKTVFLDWHRVIWQIYADVCDSKMLPPSGYHTIVTRWRALSSESRCSVPDRGTDFYLLQSIQIAAMPNGIKGAASVKQPDVQSWLHAFIWRRS